MYFDCFIFKLSNIFLLFYRLKWRLKKLKKKKKLSKMVSWSLYLTIIVLCHFMTKKFYWDSVLHLIFLLQCLCVNKIMYLSYFLKIKLFHYFHWLMYPNVFWEFYLIHSLVFHYSTIQYLGHVPNVLLLTIVRRLHFFFFFLTQLFQKKKKTVVRCHY